MQYGREEIPMINMADYFAEADLFYGVGGDAPANS
jgi:hypothetical protein